MDVGLPLDQGQIAACPRFRQTPQAIGDRRVALCPLKSVIDAVGLGQTHPEVRGNALPVRVEGGHLDAELVFPPDGLELEALLENVRRQPLGEGVPFDCHTGKIATLPVRWKEIGQREAEGRDDLLDRAPDEAMQQDGAVLVLPMLKLLRLSSCAGQRAVN